MKQNEDHKRQEGIKETAADPGQRVSGTTDQLIGRTHDDDDDSLYNELHCDLYKVRIS